VKSDLQEAGHPAVDHLPEGDQTIRRSAEHLDRVIRALGAGRREPEREAAFGSQAESPSFLRPSTDS
jgi:hypothetical protein